MDIMSFNFLEKPLWIWLLFLAGVFFLLLLDLGVLHKKQREISVKESLWMSVFYIVIALLFGMWIWYSISPESGKEFLTGFLVEKTLALDNIFVISLIFSFLSIPTIYQHKVLFWGIVGVIVLRGIMIALGATLIAQFSWILYIFAVFLIVTGFKMLYFGDKSYDISKNPFLKWIRKTFPVTDEFQGSNFFIKKIDPISNKLKRYATPLFVALLMIELVDLIFAVDSIPAIFTITLDPFIVYTSNIFAILGLRALFFALEAIIHRFKYLKTALALVLIFIGSKIFIRDLLGLEKFPADISLLVTFGLILGGILVSLYKTADKR